MLNSSLDEAVLAAFSEGEKIVETKLLRPPVAQDRVIVLVSAEQSAGELFRCEYIASEVSLRPRDHIHTQQEERLEVLEGTVRCRVAGTEYNLRRGQRIVIPPGTSHAVWNEDRLGSRSISEYRPAMNAQAMFRGYIVNP
jgi:quercetin dioxygenase-like cupin family protein